jgi:hypothetical protein
MRNDPTDYRILYIKDIKYYNLKPLINVIIIL